jgi:glycosyltransferase involved in cell wall biosynthesis
MRIGFDISQTGNGKAGCGFFADSMIVALTSIDETNEYILYPHFGTSFWDPDAKKATRKIELPNVSRKIVGMNFRDSMAFWQNSPPNGENKIGNPDIIHANNYSCPKGLKKARVVYTLYDLNFLEHPEFSTEQNRWVCFNGVYDAANYADFIISISSYSRDRFLEVFPHYPVERTRVVHLGNRLFSNGSETKQSKTLKGLEPGRFWVAVGTLEPRKNLRRLLKAYVRYVESRTETPLPLVLAGGKGWLEKDLEAFIHDLGLTGNVRLLGYVSDEDLTWLYSKCFSFVYPSLYEGFGLPVLEAMGLGAAVIASSATSLPEVAGEAAHYVNPFDELDIAEAFERLDNDVDYRTELKRKAIAQAKKFSWEKSAAEVIDIYHQVMAMSKFGHSSV